MYTYQVSLNIIHVQYWNYTSRSSTHQKKTQPKYKYHITDVHLHILEDHPAVHITTNMAFKFNRWNMYFTLNKQLKYTV